MIRPSMAKPTVNDIARAAGVSLATVDRVLNARPGVRGRTVAAVQDAVARLGYVRDIAAANLARQRSYRFVVALPEGPGQSLRDLALALERAGAQAAAARGELTLLRYPPGDAHALASALAALPMGIDGVGLLAPETPVTRDALRVLRVRGVPTVALVSDLPGTERSHFVGIDGVAAGRTAGLLMARFLPRGPARVLVVAQSMLLRDSVDRRRGFDAVMQAEAPRAQVLATIESHGSADALRAALAEAIRAEGAPLGRLPAGERDAASGGGLGPSAPDRPAGLHRPRPDAGRARRADGRLARRGRHAEPGPSGAQRAAGPAFAGRRAAHRPGAGAPQDRDCDAREPAGDRGGDL
jgi:LacI family transcriptional regulator